MFTNYLGHVGTELNRYASILSNDELYSSRTNN
jgi:hypothetical protein